MKMAHIPASAELFYGEDKAKGRRAYYPVICVRNVTLLPGVPKQLEWALKMLDKVGRKARNNGSGPLRC